MTQTVPPFPNKHELSRNFTIFSSPNPPSEIPAPHDNNQGLSPRFSSGAALPSAAVVQLSIWPDLKYRRSLPPRQFGGIFQHARWPSVPTAANAAKGSVWAVKGWLDGNTGNTAPNVGNKYLRRRKARIGQLGNGKGLTWFLVLANRVFFFSVSSGEQ